MADITHAQVLKMEAGPELDSLIAKRVMGWVKFELYRGVWTWHEPEDTKHSEPRWVQEHEDDCDHDCSCFAPSRDIAAAWEVVEKLKQSHDPLLGLWGNEDNTDDWFCALQGIEDCHAPTAPLAISHAALLTTLESKDWVDTAQLLP